MSQQENLQLAEIRLVRIRQERQEKYQHYDQLRRSATGVLQALDLGIVRSDVFRSVSEELMITIPKFWLAPALVALVSWVNDQKDLADRALGEALRRDEKKTSLFFALISRRYGRLQASRQWFDHYFRNLDPKALDPEFVPLFDGITNGVFSVDVRKMFQETLNGWLEECTHNYQLSDSERKKWKETIAERGEMGATVTDYEFVKEMSSSWIDMQRATQKHMYYERITKVFEEWLKKENEPTEKMESAIDQLLERLVFQADSEESNLKNEEKKLETIIEYDGDWKQGERMFLKEENPQNQSIHLLELIRTSAFNTNRKVSPATQKYCLALAKQWILDAHEDLTTEIRMQVPSRVELTRPGKSMGWEMVDQWTYQITDGSEELEAEKNMMECIRKSAKLEAKKYTGRGGWRRFLEGSYLRKSLFFVGGVWLIDWFLLSGMGFGFLLLPAYWYFRKRKRERPFMELKKTYQELATSLLKASVADVVDWRRDIKKKDRHAEDLPKLLKDVKAEELLQANYDKTRIVMN